MKLLEDSRCYSLLEENSDALKVERKEINLLVQCCSGLRETDNTSCQQDSRRASDSPVRRGSQRDYFGMRCSPYLIGTSRIMRSSSRAGLPRPSRLEVAK